ncbi:hypothetical protein GM182_00925 [bacterium 3DAC]|nr:hypothetical protein GM182_00925 [bacterium 3DAC]
MEFIVEVHHRGKKIMEPAPHGTEMAEIYEASDIQGIREVIVFKDLEGNLRGIYVPPKDSAYFIKAGVDENGRWVDITPPLPPGKRWIKLYKEGKGLGGVMGDIPVPPFLRDKKLVVDIDMGHGNTVRREAPQGAIRLLLAKAIKLPPPPGGQPPLIALPPAAETIEVWTDEGVTVIPFYNEKGEEIGKAEIAGIELSEDQIDIVDAVVATDMSGKPIGVIEIPEKRKAHLKVISFTPNGPMDVTPQPPPGHMWAEITITPDGGIALKDIPIDK